MRTLTVGPEPVRTFGSAAEAFKTMIQQDTLDRVGEVTGKLWLRDRYAKAHFDLDLSKSPLRPSRSRLDHSKGHVAGNVQVGSWVSNMAKSVGLGDDHAKPVMLLTQIPTLRFPTTCPLE